ncbi:SulP family inorganic anion transporter [Psychromonas sp. RZ22]|nr:SulP family inorganic anion transporter [Psychromonas sp. RZ22]
MPGIKTLANYQKIWLRDDLRAALSVAAVSLPVAIAYAQLTGVNAVVGLYSCILPMLIYALFGTSKQLMVGPDATTCAVIAAVVTPLAAGDSVKHWQLVMTMTAMTGFWCLLASRFKLGVLADFLSKPILMGLINGVAITIIVGQFSKVMGFSFDETYLVEQVISSPSYLLASHWPTLLMSVCALVIFFLIKRFAPQWPAALAVMVSTALLVWLFNLNEEHITTVGVIPSGFPDFQAPAFDLGISRELVMPALNLAMVSFVSMMLTARSFAAKNGYEIDADKEFRALGIANIASAFSQGFAVSGASSRTAVNDENGGKTQLVSIIAAVLIALVALYGTAPLQYVPEAALGIVLIIASISLIDFKALFILRKRDNSAFILALITLLAVLFIGVIPGITLAVLLGLFQFLRAVMRPTDQVLGLNKKGTIRSMDSSDKTKPIKGVFIYRFNSPLTYFNAIYFKRRIFELLAKEKETECLIIDAVPCFTHFDVSVMSMLDELYKELKQQGIRLVIAGRKRQMMKWCDTVNIPTSDGGVLIRSDLYLALKMNQVYLQALADGDAPVLHKD